MKLTPGPIRILRALHALRDEQPLPSPYRIAKHGGLTTRYVELALAKLARQLLVTASKDAVKRFQITKKGVELLEAA